MELTYQKKVDLMRVANLYEKIRKRPVISFEFSRPKNEKAAVNLDKAPDSLTSISYDYVSVTFGTGGLTREGSYELIDMLKNERGLTNTWCTRTSILYYESGKVHYEYTQEPQIINIGSSSCSCRAL